MNLSHQHKEALRALRTLTPQERLQAMWHQDQEDLHQAEKEKQLPEFRITPEEWNSLRAHILDGGGSHDAHAVLRLVLKAVMDDDQATFWAELCHLLKSAGKHLGIISVQDGMVTFSGVVPNLPPIEEKENHHVDR